MISKVADGIWRGPRPMDLEYLSLIKALGVEVVIDLESAWFLDWYSRVDTMRFIGLIKQHCPMSSLRLTPDPQIVDSAVRLMTSGVSCYVHCREGVDRTGIVVASYRIRTGWPRERAIKEMLDLGFDSYRYWMWLRWLRNHG